MKKIISTFILTVICFFMALPFIFVLMGSTHSSGWMFSIPFDYSFGDSLFVNIASLFRESAFSISLINSILVSFVTSFVGILLIGLASYSFGVYDFKGKKFAFILILILLSVPQYATLTGQLLVINRMGLYSSFLGLVVPFIINIRVFLLLNSHFDTLPKEIFDAARVDGASELEVMKSIGIPLIMDKLIIAAFLLFIASWNNFLIPMLITFDIKTFTLPVFISGIADPLRYDTGKVFIALLIQTLPIILIFSLLNKRLFVIEK
jgi:ABC-type glycerol-3-phosphate transport system permease component